MRSNRALLTLGALTVAVLAISSSAPLIAFAAAPALAIAFWRNALAAVALTPVTLGPRRAEFQEIRAGRTDPGRLSSLAAHVKDTMGRSLGLTDAPMTDYNLYNIDGKEF